MLSAATSLSLLVFGLAMASPAQATVLPCGSIITTPNTTVVLTAYIVCTSIFDVFGVAIVADNVTLDLNGHTISGNVTHHNDSSVFGVYVTSLFTNPPSGGNKLVT